MKLAEVPKITPFEFKGSLKAGDKVAVSCLTEQGDLPLTLRWLKDGAELKSSERIRIRTEDGDSDLKFRSLLPEDTAKYTCRVSNSFGTGEHTASLQVRGESFTSPNINSHVATTQLL